MVTKRKSSEREAKLARPIVAHRVDSDEAKALLDVAIRVAIELNRPALVELEKY